ELRLNSWGDSGGGSRSQEREVMLWPKSGPSQLPSLTTFSSGQLVAQSHRSRARNAKGKAIDARIAWLAKREPIPEVPAGSPSRSCAAAEPRSGGGRPPRPGGGLSYPPQIGRE